MAASNPSPRSVDALDDVLITPELATRPSRPPDDAAEARALGALVQELATNPRGVPQRLCELVLELCRAGSAGVSILEAGGESGILRWHAVAGALAREVGSTMPRDASPCGVAMARDAVQLFTEPDRFFPALRGVEPHIHEQLVAPWHLDGAPIGTLWACTHTPDGRFEAEDARLLERLARFAAAAWRTVTALEAAAAGRAEVERLVAALRASEERFRTIAEQAIDYAIFTTDADGRVETWPTGAQTVLGWKPDEIIGKPVAITFTAEDREAGIPEWEAETARAEGDVPDVRWHARKDGQRVFIEGTSWGRFGPEGEFLGLLKIGQDVTERRLAEQRRHEEEERARRELEHRVAEATAELRALSRRLLLVQEEERRGLARELHDEIGQALTGLQLQLRAVGRVEGEAHATALDEAQAILRDLTARVSQLSLDLRPAALDTLGLLPALLWYVERYQTRTGVRVDLRHEGLGRRFLPEVEIAAYRIVQEALTNVARHAGTEEVTVQILADDRALTVAVRDAGRGFDPRTVHGAGGLSGMRERVELVAGSFSVDAAPGAGVAINAELPIAGERGEGQ